MHLKDGKEMVGSAEIIRPWIIERRELSTTEDPLMLLENLKKGNCNTDEIVRQLELILQLEALEAAGTNGSTDVIRVKGCSQHLLQRRITPICKTSIMDANKQRLPPMKISGASRRLFPPPPVPKPSGEDRNPVLGEKAEESKKARDELISRRLFYNPISRSKVAMKKLSQKYLAKPVIPNRRSEKERVTTANRLHEQEVSRREDDSKRLLSKYLTNPPAKRLCADEQSISINRLYKRSQERQLAVSNVLTTKYITSTQTKFKELSEKQRTEVSKRMNSGG